MAIEHKLDQIEKNLMEKLDDQRMERLESQGKHNNDYNKATNK